MRDKICQGMSNSCMFRFRFPSLKVRKMKTIEEISHMTLSQCNEELGAMCQESTFCCVHEAREALIAATSQLCRYDVTDNNHAEYDLRFGDAVGVIADWYEDIADWSELDHDDGRTMRCEVRDAIESIAAPDAGDVDTLRDYARLVCAAVAFVIGAHDFAGNASYRVTAAECRGLILRIEVA